MVKQLFLLFVCITSQTLAQREGDNVDMLQLQTAQSTQKDKGRCCLEIYTNLSAGATFNDAYLKVHAKCAAGYSQALCTDIVGKLFASIVMTDSFNETPGSTFCNATQNLMRTVFDHQEDMATSLSRVEFSSPHRMATLALCVCVVMSCLVIVCADETRSTEHRLLAEPPRLRDRARNWITGYETAPVVYGMSAATTLASPIVAGSTKLHVVSAAGFAVGDVLRIGNREERSIGSFGPILLETPVANTYATGTVVAKIRACGAEKAVATYGQHLSEFDPLHEAVAAVEEVGGDVQHRINATVSLSV